jgi:glutathione S-transferase
LSSSLSKYILYSCSFCPFSRKIRFFLEESHVAYENKEIRYWERSEDFLKLNPACETPVLKNTETKEVVCDIFLICEYINHSEVKSMMELGYFNLMGTNAIEELEIQRLHMWFDKKFFNEVTDYIIDEMFLNTFKKNGRTPNMDKIMIALENFEKHIKYMEFLLNKRKYLGGENFSIADIAATTQISILDYLSLVEWEKHEKFKEWYISIKQKIGFRKILADVILGFKPGTVYNKLDF